MKRTEDQTLANSVLFVVVVALLVLFLLGACAPSVYRLGPGDCVVIQERESYVVAGHGCEVRRLWK